MMTGCGASTTVAAGAVAGTAFLAAVVAGVVLGFAGVVFAFGVVLADVDVLVLVLMFLCLTFFVYRFFIVSY
jgi:hypothetical protein